MPFAALWAMAHGLSGSLLRVEAVIEESYRRWAPERRVDHTLAGALLGQAALSRGHVQRAGHYLREAAARVGRDGDPLGLRPWCLAGLARAAALAGDEERARRALDEAERAAEAWPAPQALDLELARAWLSAAGGELSRAASVAVAAADAAAGRGHAVSVGLALHDAVRFGASGPLAGRLAAAGRGSRLLRAAALHAAARRKGDSRGLAEAAREFEGVGADLRAAEVWTEICAGHAGRRPDAGAEAAAARAQACLERCEGARTPALIPPVVVAPSLTPRQRDVAGLVARGLSNREVAGRLYVSLRTVENHLYQVYAKLDVSDRKDLARRLRVPAPA